MPIPKTLKVLYSPSKFFKETAENLSYSGVLLILIIFIATNILAIYAGNTKYYVQEVKPDLFKEGIDVWTEENATIWKTNGQCEKSNVSLYGEYSISCTIEENKELHMLLELPENVNCSTGEFNVTSFSLRLVNVEVTPVHAWIILLSENGNFTRNIDDKIMDWSEWNNITLPLDVEDEWNVGGAASWETVKGIKITVEFPENVTATLLLDALFFRGRYESLNRYFAVIAPQYGILYFTSFVLRWTIFGALLYLMSKYGGSELTWRHNLIVSGYSLAPLFIQGLCWAILFFLLPQIKIEMGIVTGATEMPLTATLIFNLVSYSQFAFIAWSVLISTSAMRTLNNFTTGKAASISLASCLTAFLVVRLIGF